LSAYGIPLGTAFQLRDDVLGAFGNESITGKSVGGDFHEAKPTALLAFAYQNANPQELQVLQRVGGRELSPEDIEAIQNVILDTKALEKTEALIVSLRDQAVASITEINSDARSELEKLAVAVTDRSV
jgi:geranylgeranyl diphosphate synthase type I